MSNPTTSKQSLEAQVKALLEENAKLKAQTAAQPKTITFKVSEKGAVSVYGLGRFPVTLYRESWNKLLAESDKLKSFMEIHSVTLDKVAADFQAAKASGLKVVKSDESKPQEKPATDAEIQAAMDIIERAAKARQAKVG